MSKRVRPPVRLAEVVASMSLATDLGLGQPMEDVIRSCLIGLRLGGALGLDESEQAATYYVALLAWVGCHADAHEQAMWFGDDIALKSDAYPIDLTGLRAAAFTVSHIGKGVPPLRRARLAGSFLVSGHREVEALDATHCQVAGQLAFRLGLGPAIKRDCSTSPNAGTAKEHRPDSKASRLHFPRASCSSPTSPNTSAGHTGSTLPCTWLGNAAVATSIPGSQTPSAATPRSYSAIWKLRRPGLRS